MKFEIKFEILSYELIIIINKKRRLIEQEWLSTQPTIEAATENDKGGDNDNDGDGEETKDHENGSSDAVAVQDDKEDDTEAIKFTSMMGFSGFCGGANRLNIKR